MASGISKSEVSRICAGLDEIVGAFRTRQLDHVEFPCVYLDATYLHVRNTTSQVVSMAVVVATGITTNGAREILGCDIGDSEDETFWRGFLCSLRARGLGGKWPKYRSTGARYRGSQKLTAFEIDTHGFSPGRADG